MGKQAQRHYGQAMDAFLQFSRKVEAGAGDPDRVAAAVQHALTTRRSRTRYQVGIVARMIVALSRLLPTRTMDALLSRAVGLPRRMPDR